MGKAVFEVTQIFLKQQHFCRTAFLLVPQVHTCIFFHPRGQGMPPKHAQYCHLVAMIAQFFPFFSWLVHSLQNSGFMLTKGLILLSHRTVRVFHQRVFTEPRLERLFAEVHGTKKKAAYKNKAWCNSEVILLHLTPLRSASFSPWETETNVFKKKEDRDISNVQLIKWRHKQPY